MSTNCLVVDASTAVHIVPDYYFETHKISGVTGDLKPGDLGKFYDGDFEGWGKVMVTGEADVLKKKAQDFDYPDVSPDSIQNINIIPVNHSFRCSML